MKKNSIFITGIHRSGTTIVSRLLKLAGRCEVIDEPLNYDIGLKEVQQWYPRITKHTDIPEKEAFRRFMNGDADFKRIDRKATTSVTSKVKSLISNSNNIRYFNAKNNPFIKNIIIKDPLAALSTEWILAKYGLKTIITIKNPFAFITSLKRVGWSLPLDTFFKDKVLKLNYAEHWIPGDFIIEGAILWNMIYSELDKIMGIYPNLILPLKIEDLSSNYDKVLSDVFSFLEFKYTKRIAKKAAVYFEAENGVNLKTKNIHILKRDSKAGLDAWQTALKSDEIKLITKITQPLLGKYYSDILRDL